MELIRVTVYYLGFYQVICNSSKPKQQQLDGYNYDSLSTDAGLLQHGFGYGPAKFSAEVGCAVALILQVLTYLPRTLADWQRGPTACS